MRSAGSPSGSIRGGGHRFPQLPSSRDPPIPQRLVAVPRDQLPLASLQGLPGKTGIPAIPRPPAPAPRVPQSRGWALPPGWDSSAARCIEEGGEKRGKERGEGGEGNQRIVAASALAVFSAQVKDLPHSLAGMPQNPFFAIPPVTPTASGTGG